MDEIKLMGVLVAVESARSRYLMVLLVLVDSINTIGYLLDAIYLTKTM